MGCIIFLPWPSTNPSLGWKRRWMTFGKLSPSLRRKKAWRNELLAPDNSALAGYVLRMSTATARLISEFEALRVEEKQEFMREIIPHLPPWDSGPLSDDVAAAAGDRLAAMHDEDE